MAPSLFNKKYVYVSLIVMTIFATFLIMSLTTNIKFFPLVPKSVTFSDNVFVVTEGQEEALGRMNVNVNTQKIVINGLGNDTVKEPSQPHMVLDSIRDTAITQEEIRNKFTRCIKVSSQRLQQCVDVHKKSKSYWRSSGLNANSHEDDIKRMNLASKCGAFDHVELMAENPRDPPFPWEQDYLSQPPLYSMLDTAWASKSSVTWLRDPDKTTLTMGDKVKFKIVLVDGKGEPRKRGGDSVRLWLSSKNVEASIAADVIDNKDGSYLATAILPWSGSIEVKATIAHTRELFRTNLYIQRLFTTTHWFTGTFQNGHASEATPCSPLPGLPGFPAPEVCNLTETNGGFPWYCGKPVKHKLLNCSHWISVRKIDAPSYYPLSEAEEELIKLTETRRPFLIPNNISLTVNPNKESQTVLPLPDLKCNQRKLSLTFEDTNLSGFFYKNSWRPMACQLPKVDKEFLLSCLKDTQFIIIGDSNSRFQMDALREMTQCTDKIPRQKVIWHAPLRCEDDKRNVSIRYFPPKHPFYGSVGEAMKHHVLYSSIHMLDSIPSHGKYLIMLHNFLHMVPFHLSITEHRFRLMRDAVQRLLARNPHVTIIYQSVHSAYDRTIRNKHKMNAFLLELQRQMFKGLGERVMFVLTWPMTVATANDNGHPSFFKEITRLYMGYVCGRL